MKQLSGAGCGFVTISQLKLSVKMRKMHGGGENLDPQHTC